MLRFSRFSNATSALALGLTMLPGVSRSDNLLDYNKLSQLLDRATQGEDDVMAKAGQQWLRHGGPVDLDNPQFDEDELRTNLVFDQGEVDAEPLPVAPQAKSEGSFRLSQEGCWATARAHLYKKNEYGPVSENQFGGGAGIHCPVLEWDLPFGHMFKLSLTADFERTATFTDIAYGKDPNRLFDEQLGNFGYFGVNLRLDKALEVGGFNFSPELAISNGDLGEALFARGDVKPHDGGFLPSNGEYVKTNIFKTRIGGCVGHDNLPMVEVCGHYDSNRWDKVHYQSHEWQGFPFEHVSGGSVELRGKLSLDAWGFGK